MKLSTAIPMVLSLGALAVALPQNHAPRDAAPEIKIEGSSTETPGTEIPGTRIPGTTEDPRADTAESSQPKQKELVVLRQVQVHPTGLAFDIYDEKEDRNVGTCFLSNTFVPFDRERCRLENGEMSHYEAFFDLNGFSESKNMGVVLRYSPEGGKGNWKIYYSVNPVKDNCDPLSTKPCKDIKPQSGLQNTGIRDRFVNWINKPVDFLTGG